MTTKYRAFPYESGMSIKIPMDIDYSVYRSEERTLKNLNKMFSDGRKCVVIIPEKILDKTEVDQYRKFFCKKAKEDKVNYIYFTVPVKIYKKVKIYKGDSDGVCET